MYNVQDSFLDGAGNADLFDDLSRGKWGCVVMMSTFDHLATMARCQELANRHPKNAVIYRKWIPQPGNPGYGDNHWQYISPDQWIAEHDLLKNGKVWAYMDNEPAFSDESLQWYITTAKRAVAAGIKCVIGNWSVGVPEAQDWERPKALELLRLIAQYPGRLALGLHEYFPALWNYPIQHPAEPNPQRWITHPPPSAQALYFVGRYRNVLKAAARHGITLPPRSIYITEGGLDRIHAVGDWQQGLAKTPGHAEIIGFWSLTEQFRQWGHDPEVFLYQQMQAMWNVIYKPAREIGGYVYYTYRNDDNQDRDDHNIYWARQFRRLYKEGDFSVSTTPTPPPQPPPSTSPLLGILELTPGIVLNYRDSASLDGEVLGKITSGAQIAAVMGSLRDVTYTWLKLRTRIGTQMVEGWAAVAGPDWSGRIVINKR